jgi:hypothetical protein
MVPYCWAIQEVYGNLLRDYWLEGRKCKTFSILTRQFPNSSLGWMWCGRGYVVKTCRSTGQVMSIQSRSPMICASVRQSSFSRMIQFCRRSKAIYRYFILEVKAVLCRSGWRKPTLVDSSTISSRTVIIIRMMEFDSATGHKMILAQVGVNLKFLPLVQGKLLLGSFYLWFMSRFTIWFFISGWFEELVVYIVHGCLGCHGWFVST